MVKKNYNITPGDLYTREEQEKILEHVRGEASAGRIHGRFKPVRDAVAIEILFYSGIKTSELLDIRWEAVDLTNKRLIIMRHNRKVRIPQKLCKVLRDYYIYCMARIQDYVMWGTRYRGRWSLPAFNKSLGGLSKRVGIVVKASRIRHTYARNFWHLTGDLKATQRQMGHRQVEFTLLYTNL